MTSTQDDISTASPSSLPSATTTTVSGETKKAKALAAAKRDNIPEALKAQCLATSLYELTKQYTFYGSMLQVMNIQYDFYVPTAGVGFNSDMKRLDLHINPTFFCKALNAQQRVAVLLHEIFHVTNQHLTRIPFMKVSNHKRKLLNIAGDMAINQNIQNLPHGCSKCPPIAEQQKGARCENEKEGLCCGHCIDVNDFFDEDDKGKKQAWPKGRTMEQYYELLLNRYTEPPDEYDPKRIEVKAIAQENFNATKFGIKASKTLTAVDDGIFKVGDIEVPVGESVLLQAQDDLVDCGVYTVKDAGSDTSKAVLVRNIKINGTHKSEARIADCALIKGKTKKENVTYTLIGDNGEQPAPGREVVCDKHIQMWAEGEPNDFFSSGGDGTPREFDSHEWEGAEEGETMDAVEDLVKRAMIKSSTSYDNLPGSIKDLLDSIKTRRAELNYKQLILSAIKRSASGHDRKSTWCRKNKRYGFLAAGTTISNLPKLDVFLDTSGSISIEELSNFLDIIDEFLKVGSRKCTVNMFHTSHYLRKPYKSGDREDLKKSVQSGGTDLADVLKSVLKHGSDLTLIITDGYYSDVPYETWMKPGQKMPEVLWIISKGGEKNHPLVRIGNTIKVPNG